MSETLDYGSIHINYARFDRVSLRRCHCPTCKKNSFFAEFHQDWYGWDSTCLRCGERWQDSEMCDRPFLRGWRKQSIEDAKRMYRKWKTILSQPLSAKEEM